MASLPASQRPSPGSQRSSTPSTSPTQSHVSINETSSSKDNGTEPILLNPSPSSKRLQESSEGGLGPAQQPLQRQESVDVRRCWICYSDETEDTPLSSAWRSPCPCALTAHEACLLDWVADLEVSNSGRSRRILCPQCKGEIRIARPRSFIVDITKGIEAAAGRLVLPSILVLGSSTIMYLSLSYGVVAVHMVLGSGDFSRIFGSDTQNPSQTLRRMFGLSIVPWMLVLSRTSIADSVLPIVPMLFFVTQPRPDPLDNFTNWPPSAGLSFAVLPYVRAAYNAYYEYVWGDRVRRWLEEVKPRTGSTTESDGLELEIGVEDGDDTDDDMPPLGGEEQENLVAHPLNAPPLDRANPPPIFRAEANIPAPAQPAAQAGINNRMNVRRDYSISVSRVAQSVLGALAFPAVSAIMGDALRVFLPASWILLGTGFRTKPTRLLQTRWGRCIAGGCLFVVFKDAVALYVRWKMAQNHRQRKVVDYDKSKARRRGTTKT
jgi:hypothetical protein